MECVTGLRINLPEHLKWRGLFLFFLKQVSSSYGCNDNVCLVRTPKSEGQPDEISTGWDY